MRPVSEIMEADSPKKVNKRLRAGWILLCIAPTNKKPFSYCLGLPKVVDKAGHIAQ